MNRRKEGHHYLIGNGQWTNGLLGVTSTVGTLGRMTMEGHLLSASPLNKRWDLTISKLEMHYYKEDR